MKYKPPGVSPVAENASQENVPLASVGSVVAVVRATMPTPGVVQVRLTGDMGEASPAPGLVSGLVGTANSRTFQLAAVPNVPPTGVAGMVNVHAIENVDVDFSCAVRRISLT